MTSPPEDVNLVPSIRHILDSVHTSSKWYTFVMPSTFYFIECTSQKTCNK